MTGTHGRFPDAAWVRIPDHEGVHPAIRLSRPVSGRTWWAVDAVGMTSPTGSAVFYPDEAVEVVDRVAVIDPTDPTDTSRAGRLWGLPAHVHMYAKYADARSKETSYPPEPGPDTIVHVTYADACRNGADGLRWASGYLPDRDGLAWVNLMNGAAYEWTQVCEGSVDVTIVAAPPAAGDQS